MNRKIILVILILILIILVTMSYYLGKKSCISALTEVRKSSVHNNGIFANYNIKKNTIIEKSPYLTIREKPGILNDYVFSQKKKLGQNFLILGNGSIYNHSNNHNIDHTLIDEFFYFYTNKDIKKDEELFISYGDNYWKTRKKTPQ